MCRSRKNRTIRDSQVNDLRLDKMGTLERDENCLPLPRGADMSDVHSSFHVPSTATEASGSTHSVCAKTFVQVSATNAEIDAIAIGIPACFSIFLNPLLLLLWLRYGCLEGIAIGASSGLVSYRKQAFQVGSHHRHL